MTNAPKINFDSLPGLGSPSRQSAAIRIDGEIVGMIEREEWRQERHDCVEGSICGPLQIECVSVTSNRNLDGDLEVYERFPVPVNTKTWTREATGEVYEFVCEGWKKSDLRYTRAAARDTLNQAKRWVRENAHRF